MDLAGEGNYETPTVFKAKEVLPPDMQRGDRFVVREHVENDGIMNHYLVDSDFGPFEACSDPALAKLIQEIGALDQLSDRFKDELARLGWTMRETAK